MPTSEERRKVMQQYGMSEEDLAAMEEEGPAKVETDLWGKLLLSHIHHSLSFPLFLPLTLSLHGRGHGRAEGHHTRRAQEGLPQARAEVPP